MVYKMHYRYSSFAEAGLKLLLNVSSFCFETNSNIEKPEMVFFFPGG